MQPAHPGALCCLLPCLIGCALGHEWHAYVRTYVRLIGFIQYFKTEYPHIQIDMGKIPLGGLTILRVPKTQTMPAEFIMDSITGEIGAAPQAVQKKRQRSYLRT
mmetsp:Transcript_39769/g.113405  ORF Transcript_39769/g.113405 Transcript_39769/m.113405 type:complete len:104 (+) Transcript_39769:1196-1507(+)